MLVSREALVLPLRSVNLLIHIQLALTYLFVKAYATLNLFHVSKARYSVTLYVYRSRRTQ